MQFDSNDVALFKSLVEAPNRFVDIGFDVLPGAIPTFSLPQKSADVVARSVLLFRKTLQSKSVKSVATFRRLLSRKSKLGCNKTTLCNAAFPFNHIRLGYVEESGFLASAGTSLQAGVCIWALNGAASYKGFQLERGRALFVNEYSAEHLQSCVDSDAVFVVVFCNVFCKDAANGVLYRGVLRKRTAFKDQLEVPSVPYKTKKRCHSEEDGSNLVESPRVSAAAPSTPKNRGDPRHSPQTDVAVGQSGVALAPPGVAQLLPQRVAVGEAEVAQPTAETLAVGEAVGEAEVVQPTDETPAADSAADVEVAIGLDDRVQPTDENLADDSAAGVAGAIGLDERVVQPHRANGLLILVHRIWLSASDAVTPIGKSEIASIASFHKAGYRQIVWTTVPGDEMRRVLGAFGGVSVTDVAVAVPNMRDIHFMMQHNTPLQHIKDAISFKLIYLYGGIYADLKFLALPRYSFLDEATSATFATEPVRQTPLQTIRGIEFSSLDGNGVTVGQIWLALFGSPAAGAEMFSDLYDEVFRFWLCRSRRVEKGTAAAVDWRKGYHPLWMRNTQLAHDKVQSMPYTVSMRPPWASCALPPFLKSMAQLGKHSAFYGGAIHDIKTIVDNTSVCFICTWRRQWTMELRAAVQQCFEDTIVSSDLLESQRIAIEKRRAFQSELNEKYQPELITWLGFDAAYTVLAIAHNIIQRQWFLRFFQSEEDADLIASLLQYALHFHYGSKQSLPCAIGHSNEAVTRLLCQFVQCVATEAHA